MLQAYQLLHNRFQIESTEGKLCLLIVSTGHVAQLPEVGGKVVQLGNGITHHFIHGLLVGTHCFVIEKRDAHLQGLHGRFNSCIMVLTKLSATRPHGAASKWSLSGTADRQTAEESIPSCPEVASPYGAKEYAASPAHPLVPTPASADCKDKPDG